MLSYHSVNILTQNPANLISTKKCIIESNNNDNHVLNNNEKMFYDDDDDDEIPSSQYKSNRRGVFAQVN